MKLKPLKAIAYLPFATPEGDLVTNVGYDVKTCIFTEVDSEGMKPVSEAPSNDELIAALKTMWVPWSGYRFATANDYASMVSAIITAVCRPALRIAPAYFFDAPVQGSGKTKCASALATLTRGKQSGVTPYVEGAGVEAETVKKLVAMLIGGESFWLIDNVVGIWRSSVIASLITDGAMSERILGGNQWYRGEARLMICATGNNASLDRDLGRRFIRIRIDTGVETPQARNFQFDPAEMALATRMEIAHAVLTIIQGFWKASPVQHGGDAGFSEWNRLVRQCVLWLGSSGVSEAAGLGKLGDPAYSIMEEASADDPETSAHLMLMTGLFDMFTGVAFQAKDVLRVWEIGERSDTDDPAGMVREGLNALLRQPSHGKPTAIGIGRVLQHRRDRVVNGMCFRLTGTDRNGVRSWTVASAGSAGTSGT